ncbi:MAG: nucleotidyltransferase domain-containing protein [Thermomicrobiales bacterium]|nr:nucleotidyltransferase domain-containing protein [Thermomicrobiales bacterium]MCO5222152.1 nucleotidyltransferase domain-containing protein [Thermomicrobiales bacterium]
MIDLITENLPAITALCEKYGVRKLEVFGSATDPDRFDPETSDIDFVIDFLDYGPGIADRFFGFAEDVEQLLGRHADFIFGDKPIKNPYLRASVNKSRVTIYESANRKAAA